MTAEAVAVGAPAPDFTLPSTGGEDVTLSSYRGRSNVLLAFFPLAFTGVCTAELCDFSHDIDRFRASGTTVFGISVDSVPALGAFAAQSGISVELLSDFRRTVCRAYGTLDEERFFSRRAYFLIDRGGVLRWSFSEATLGHKRENAELLDRIAALA